MPRNRSDHGQQRPGLLRVRQRRRVLQVNKQTTNVITTTKKARERLEMPESEQRCPSCHHRRKLARANPIQHHPCFFHQNCKYIDMFCISPPPGRSWRKRSTGWPWWSQTTCFVDWFLISTNLSPFAMPCRPPISPAQAVKQIKQSQWNLVPDHHGHLVHTRSLQRKCWTGV